MGFYRYSVWGMGKIKESRRERRRTKQVPFREEK